MQFDLTFKNERERTYHLITLFYVVLHALYFIYLLFDTALWKQGVAGIVIIVVYSTYKLLIKINKQKFYFGSGIFYLLSLFFGITGWWWLFGLEMIISTFCFFLFQERSVYFTSYLIEVRKRPYKSYKWSDLQNVVLKDNMLTLDFKNNTLVQGEIESPIDENAFNTFAKEQLAKRN